MIYRKKRNRSKKFQPDSPNLQEIEDYNSRVAGNKITPNMNNCPQCREKSDSFKRHDTRKRILNIINDQIITAVICLLVRWKCPECGKTFTQYPDFAMPYKRFSTSTIISYSRRYVADDSMSYRRLSDICPNAYSSDGESALGPGHSTIHRWTKTLGEYQEIPIKAQKKILDKSPRSSIKGLFNQLSVFSGKYRSEYRRIILVRCIRLLKLDTIFRTVFDTAIFSGLAQSCFFR